MAAAYVYRHYLKAKRLGSGMNVCQLASQLGIAFSTLARIERGEGLDVESDRVEKLAKVLHAVHSRYGSRPFDALSVEAKEQYRRLAHFVLNRCDEFSIHNLLGQAVPPKAACEVVS